VSDFSITHNASINGIQQGGFPRRVESEEHSYRTGEDEGQKDCRGREENGPLRKTGEAPSFNHPHPDSQDSSHEAEHKGFDQELEKNIPTLAPRPFECRSLLSAP